MAVVEHRIQVTSAGGAGTSALLYHLHLQDLDLPRTPDWRPFKHQLQPPGAGEVPDGFAAVFMLSDPRDAVISLYRRGFQRDHPNAPERLDRFQTLRLQRLRWWVFGREDLFRMDEQLDRWLEAEVPVLFVSHAGVGEWWPTIAEFLGDPALPAPRWKTRRSRWEQEHPVLRLGLQRVYGRLAARIDALDPVTVNEAGRPFVGGHVPVLARP